jgi:hypothetical protein
VAHHAVVVAHHRARVAAVTVTGMTVTVQAVMAGVMIGVMIVRRVVVDAPSGVMIGQQVVVDAQQANPPIMIAVKRGQPVAAVLKVAVAQTVMPVQIAMIAQIVIVLQNVMIAQTVTPAQTVKVTLKDAIITLVQPAAASRHSVTSQPAVASQHLVTSQPAAVSRHLAASPPLTNVQILVTSQRRKSHHPIEAMVAQNAHHLPRKSALAQRGQAAMPPHRAARAR